MNRFNNYAKYIVFAFIAAILAACGNGTCNTAGPVQDIYSFPNGSQLYGSTNFTVSSGTSVNGTYTLKGGQVPFAVKLSTSNPLAQQNTALSGNLNDTCELCGTFNPELLVLTQSISESSSTLTVQSSANLAPGTYTLYLFAEGIGATVFPKQQIGVITIVVNGAQPSPTPSPTVTPAPTPTPDYKIIFFAANNGNGWSGNLLSQALSAPVNATGLTTGIQGADAICQYEAAQTSWHPNLPSGKTWKALIVDGVNRVACITPDCGGGTSENVDWVLLPSTQYVNENLESSIFTNSSAVYTSWPSVNPMISPYRSFNQTEYWTGLNDDWTLRRKCGPYPFTTECICGGWMNNNAESLGYLGYQDNSSSVLDGSQIGDFDKACSFKSDDSHIAGIMCVQQ